uniref:Uncharacterized protein n=1 Tax=Fagus sylvatica TaxID=28930 RepID=A0A2N9HLZ0_FAGSY
MEEIGNILDENMPSLLVSKETSSSWNSSLLETVAVEACHVLFSLPRNSTDDASWKEENVEPKILSWNSSLLETKGWRPIEPRWCRGSRGVRSRLAVLQTPVVIATDHEWIDQILGVVLGHHEPMGIATRDGGGFGLPIWWWGLGYGVAGVVVVAVGGSLGAAAASLFGLGPC